MKRRVWIIGLILLASMQVKAAAPVSPCDTDMFWQVFKDSLPKHYCECTYNTEPFAFPVDTVITEPVWFSATIDDIKQGLSAYWFSDDYVVMDVYAFCVSHKPTFSMTVGPNRMYEMEKEMIDKKMSEIGGTAEMLKALEPRIHVYTLHGGSGHVYCYPYGQGPHSTCENPIELRAWMTYVCDHAENSYRLPAKNMPSSGKAFLHWTHKPVNSTQKCRPADIRLTLDSCNGEELAHVVLPDSMHVYTIDSAMLADTRKAGKDIWVHVTHEEGIVGRLRYFTNPKYTDPLPAVKKTTCLGKSIIVSERTYLSDTAFVDTVWVNRDTLTTQQLNLTFTQPALSYDTAYVDPRDLQYGVVHPLTGAVLFHYGDTIVDVVKPNTCTKRYQITVMDPNPINIIDAGTARPRKQMQNGQLIILMDDRKYNVVGQQIDEEAKNN